MAFAGSGGGAEPPHRRPLRPPGHRDDDFLLDDEDLEGDDADLQPPLKKKKRGERGPAKGLKVLEARRKIGGLKLPLTRDPTYPTKAHVGPYQAMYKSEVGRITRVRCPPGKPWEDIDLPVQNQIVHEIEQNFENVVPEIVLSDARELFRKGKSRLKTSVKKHKEKQNDVPPPKPDNVETDQYWAEYLEFLTTPKFLKKSDINAKNRGKRLYNTLNGRKSYSQRRMEGGAQGADPFIVWMNTHQNKDGTWVSEAASQTFDELMRLRLEISPDGSRLTVAQTIDVFRRVLGPRRDCIVGIGPSQPSSSRTQLSQSLLSQISEKDKALAEKDKALAEKDKAIIEGNNRMKVIMASLKAANIPIVHIESNNDGGGDEGGDGGGDEGGDSGWDDALA